MDLGLKKLRILVTGSSRGLGFATVRTLLEEGACVVMNGRQPDRLEDARQNLFALYGDRVHAFAGDLTDPAFPAALIEQSAQVLGGLDILIANAGGPPPGAFESFTDEAWQQAIDLSFMSQVRLIRASLPFLRQSPSPSVLSITSYSVKQPIPYLILSNSIRLATIGMIKTLALELGHENIRFNSILPGWTETERVYTLMEARAKQNQTTPDEEARKQSNDSPLKRMGNPQEFANMAVFLVSPAASYVTGAMIGVDGGMYKGTL